MTDANTATFRQVRAFALDVDGVLTDGGLWWGGNGEEWKRFCFADIMGLSLARRAGLALGLISGENSPLVDRYAAKMHIAFVVKNCHDKASALRDFAASARVEMREICYMGDDVNDLAAMEIAGVSAAPSDAMREAREIADIVTEKPGGNGAVREVVDVILAAKNLNAREVLRRP